MKNKLLFGLILLFSLSVNAQEKPLDFPIPISISLSFDAIPENGGKQIRFSPKKVKKVQIVGIVEETVGKRKIKKGLIKVQTSGDTFSKENYWVSMNWLDKASTDDLAINLKEYFAVAEGNPGKIICGENTEPVETPASIPIVAETLPEVVVQEQLPPPVEVKPPTKIDFTPYVGITDECKENIGKLDPTYFQTFRKNTWYLYDMKDYEKYCLDKSSPSVYPGVTASMQTYINSGNYGDAIPSVCKTYAGKTIDDVNKVYENTAYQLRSMYKEMKHDVFVKEIISSKEKTREYVAKHEKNLCLREARLMDKIHSIPSIKSPIPGCSDGQKLSIPPVTFGGSSGVGFNTSMLSGQGSIIMNKIVFIASDKNMSCEQKNARLKEVISGSNAVVSTLDDYVLMRFMAQNAEDILGNPAFVAIVRDIIDINRDLSTGPGGDDNNLTHVCLDGNPSCLTNKLTYITLRNFMAGKYLEVMKDYKLSSTYKFGTLTPAQQAEFADKVIAELNLGLKNPQKLYSDSESFRNQCDEKVSRLFMKPPGFCTVSGCGPDKIKDDKLRKEIGTNTTGNILCPNYDSGRDGRFHCYVDKKLTSTKQAESTLIDFLTPKAQACFKGSGLHLAKAHNNGNRFGGVGGGGSIDQEQESGYLHIHMDFRVPYTKAGKKNSRVDPVDLFCRGACE